MKPYYEHGGITIYHGDARDLAGQLEAEAIITDPVWPNSVFPKVENPQELLAQVLARVRSGVERIVVELGCTSDPRFLAAVPARWSMFRVCWLEYARCSYIGRVLYTGDVAYVFGNPPAARPGAMVLPGRFLSSRSDGRRGTGRKIHKSRQLEAYDRMPHPAPRNLQHVQWLCKWFGGASVLDPFGGSGTTAVACKALGIPCTLIEIEERYCELAVSRLGQESLDLVDADADLTRCLAEQSTAADQLRANPGDAGAQQWLEDQVKEEVLIRLEGRGI